MPLLTRAPTGLVAALLAVGLFDEWASFVPAGSFESFRHDLDLNYAQASAVLSAAAPGAIAGNAFTLAADYVSRRAIASLGAFAYAAALVAFALADSFTALLAASFVLGAASTAMVDAAGLALVDVAGDALETMLARANLLGAVGDFAGPITIFAVTGVGFGWRAPFVVVAVAMAAYGCWLARAPLPPPPPAHERDHPVRAVWSVVRDRRVWFYAAVCVLGGPLDEPFQGFLIAFARERRGMSATGALLIALCAIVGSVGGFAFLSRRSWTRAFSLRASATTMAVATVGLVVVPWPPAMATAALTFGVAAATLWNGVETRILRLRPGQTGAVTAVISTIEFAAFGVPIVFGAVADAAGITAGFACYAATAVALALLVTRAPSDVSVDAADRA